LKDKYYLLPSLVVVLFYVFMFFVIPAPVGKYEVSLPDVSAIDKSDTPHRLVKHYRVDDEQLKSYQARGIFKYGRSDPMLPLSGLIPDGGIPDEAYLDTVEEDSVSEEELQDE